MIKFYLKSVLIFIALAFGNHIALSQGFTPTDYRKALWMTTRMYGGQRSGENNWLVYDHLPSGVDESLRGKCFINDKDIDGYDISGGWHDCGDHVKFGQTQFYSGYMLLKGYDEFPSGYNDYYSYDYKGYKSSGDWTWEGGSHEPNGIPDILDELKHATDYFIKCTRNSSTFYYQVGDGTVDHTNWVTAVKMQTLPVNQGGEQRMVLKNPQDASMPSFCGATLALMSKVYRKFDPSYADTCLKHALYAYDYAKAHPGGVGADPFYSGNRDWHDDYSSMCAELFWVTGNLTYKTEAFNFSIGNIVNSHQDFDYNNNEDIALYNLAKLGNSMAKDILNSVVNSYYLGRTQADGQFSGGDISWGTLRYNANAAFIVALWQKLNNQTTIHNFIYKNIDYILGRNARNYSFVVGFGQNYPQHPHHRNIYLDDNNLPNASQNTLVIPNKNKQFGYLVGGTRNPFNYTDDVNNYSTSEGGIDYSACLVGVLGYINSKLAPVDTNMFNHSIPKLGSLQSICGLTNLTLDSKVKIDNKKTFTWKKDNVIIQTASLTANTLLISEPGIYTCIIDSLGKWSTQANVKVVDFLPEVNLGSDKELCTQTTFTFDLGFSSPALKYEWKKNDVVLKNAKERTLNVISEGKYRGTISALGCASKYAEVTITSGLISVSHDTICNGGTVNLEILSSGGPYEWYTTPSNGTPINTGFTYSPVINSSNVYYVKDANSINTMAGPSSSNNSMTGPQFGTIGIRFTAMRAYTITQMKVIPYVFGCLNNDPVSVTFQLKNGSTVLGTYASASIICQGTGSSTLYTLNFPTPINIPASGDYSLVQVAGNQIVCYDNGANFTTMDANGVMDITDDIIDFKPNTFPAIFDIKIQSGSSCSRTPVYAIIDNKNENCMDCNGVKGGSAYLDDCQTCVGGTTGEVACVKDCNGVVDGTAYLDNCQTCVEGNTGKTACTQDCNGVYGGIAYLDNCQTCVEGNTGKTACTEDCNGVFGGTAYLDNCQTCVGGTTTKTACAKDCNNDFGGTAYLDDCQNCVDGNTGETACIQDCNGDFGGSAYLDNCQICIGGNTGLTECVTSATTSTNFITKFEVYPNPFQSSFKLNYETEGNENVLIEIFNTYGEIVASKTGSANGSYNYSLDTGIYYLKISNSHKLVVKKIVGN